MATKNLSGKPITIITITTDGDVGGLLVSRDLPGSTVELVTTGMTISGISSDVRGSSTDVVELSLSCSTVDLKVKKKAEIAERPTRGSTEDDPQ